MKKYDSLLKRVEQFERMAFYSDRRTFLQALAQNAGVVLPADVKQQIGNLITNLGTSNQNKAIRDKLDTFVPPTGQYGGGSIGVEVTKPVDANELADIIMQAANAFPSDLDHAPMKQSAVDLSNKVKQLAPATHMTTWQDLRTKEEDATPSQPTTSKPTYQYIPKETQRQLNSLLAEEINSGKMQSLTEDGSLGPKTQQAIEAFKKRYRAAGTPLDIDKAYKLHGAMQQAVSS